MFAVLKRIVLCCITRWPFICAWINSVVL